MQARRILGVDPGLVRTGWGVVALEGSRLRHLGNGICESRGETLGRRLLSLFEGLTEVLDRFCPEAAAVERTFVNRDGAGTLKLGQARGVAMLALARAGLSIGEYAPNAVKKTVVGVGHADKAQVEYMVRLQLGACTIAGPDAADALAVAICHAHHMGSPAAAAAGAGAGAGAGTGAGAGSAGAVRARVVSAGAVSAGRLRGRKAGGAT